jgi:hypothetical protein
VVGIPDVYERGQPELIALLKERGKPPAKAAMGWLSGGSGPGLAYLPVPGQELV